MGEYVSFYFWATKNHKVARGLSVKGKNATKNHEL